MNKLVLFVIIPSILLAWGLSTSPAGVDNANASENIDIQVRQFLDSHRWSWRDANVSEVDGQALHDIILKHGYKNTLEIGTSTGHSSIWIAWALSKTGGNLITIEIDAYKRKEALANFKEADVDEYIDARLGDAHELVPELEGPFDFVFCDADKNWYNTYLESVLPKLTVGGCFAAHNVSEGSFRRGFGGRFRGRFGGGDFLQFARSFPNLQTEVLELRGSAGLSVSYKVAENRLRTVALHQKD